MDQYFRQIYTKIIVAEGNFLTYFETEAVGYFPYNIKSLQIISLQHNIPTDNFPTFFCPYR